MVKVKLDSRLKTFASSMRSDDSTDEERKLWYLFFKNYKIKFRRQKVLDGFIADFYCPLAKLVVELDGSQHYSDYGKTYDQWRSGIIEKNGILVLRFSNIDIRKHFDGVCLMIDHITRRRIQEIIEAKEGVTSRLSPPLGGE